MGKASWFQNPEALVRSMAVPPIRLFSDKTMLHGGGIPAKKDGGTLSFRTPTGNLPGKVAYPCVAEKVIRLGAIQKAIILPRCFFIKSLLDSQVHIRCYFHGC
jgi:hypothetical protein